MFVNPMFRINSDSKDVEIDGQIYHYFHLQQLTYEEQQMDLLLLNFDDDLIESPEIIPVVEKEDSVEI